MGEGRKKALLIVVPIVVGLVVVAGVLAYLYQPVRGTMSSSTTTVCVGCAVLFGFVPDSGLSPFTYEWTFGDGESATVQNPSHAWVFTGTYTVTVTVTDGYGVKGTWSLTIIVRSALVFIDKVQVELSAILGTSNTTLSSDYDYNMWVDGNLIINQGRQPHPDYLISFDPGSHHTIQIQIKEWVFGFENTKCDDQGTLIVPSASVDEHYTLWYHTTIHSFKTDGRMADYVLIRD